jgi:streptogramin lyase
MLDGTAVAPGSASDAQIVFQTPAHDNGIVTIKLSGNGPSAYTEFLYVPPRLQDLPPGYITTVAGIGLFTGLYRPATQAEVYPQGSPAFDRQGNMYIPEPNINRVTRVRPDGIVEPFAGSGIPDYQSTTGIGDGGPATEASVTFPRGVTADAASNVYITEHKSRIRRVDAQGIITTIAGDGTRGFSGDGGQATQARLNAATQITGDGNGTLFFIDFDDTSSVARIRKITPDGIISTVAGVGPPGFSGDGGPATQAQFNLIYADRGSLALDSQGNLFIEDSGNDRLRRIDSRSGIITTVYGPAPLDWGGVAADQSGNIFFCFNNSIIKMDSSGQILNTYGRTAPPGTNEDDGTPIQDASISSHGLAIDPSGNIVYAETHRVRRLNLSTGLLETLAGMGTRIIGDNGPAIATYFARATDLAFLPSGELLIGDQGHFIVRKLDGNGNISTFAKNEWASFNSPMAIEPDRDGNVFVADMWNVIRIDSTVTPSLFVGRKQQYGYSGDGGPATQALLCEPFDVAIDRAGNLFIADTNNNRIRRVDAQTGIITTVAGSGPVNGFEHFESDGQGSFSGDGGPATQATLNTPYGVAVDSQGNLFIADGGNRRIRKVDTNGIITTFAANTGPGVNKLAFDGAGNLYSVFNTGLVRYDPTGRSTQLAGQWPQGFSGDGGPALQARTRTTAQSVGVAIDAEGNVFFVDAGNLRIRAVRYGAVMAEPGSTVAASGGSAQMAALETTFPTALQITLKSPEGTPENGIRVDFAAPTSGASCTFAGGSSTFSTLTNIDGYASVTCTANSQAGSYSVTATPLALGQSASFSLTNTIR